MDMETWHVEFVNSTAEAEFLELPKDVQARLTRTLELFEVHGPAALVMPLAKPVRDKLWELRARGRDGIARSLYVLTDGKRMVIARTFAKKTRKTPSREIALALKRLEDMT